jgi:DNA repair protein RadC
MEHTIASVFEVAEVLLVYRNPVRPSNRPKITTSQSAYDLLMQLWDRDQIELAEQAKVLLLNRCNRVLGMYQASSGGVSGTVMDPKLIFSVALKANAPAIILAHNHPSGNLVPSAQDHALTTRIVEAGKLLDIIVIDHLIVTTEGYCSFRDEGML